MTIQDWGAIGEILGAIAVVASLIYLAVQIRTSNRVAHQVEAQEITDQTLQFLNQISASNEVTELWIRGCADDETLSTTELVRFRYLLFQLVAIWQRMHMLDETGNLVKGFWINNEKQRRHLMASPGFHSWFQEFKVNLDEKWRLFLESELKQTPNEYRPMGVGKEIADHTNT